jgi:Tfp pilus assembly protein PilV
MKGMALRMRAAPPQGALGERGFTMIETVVALVVMMVVGLGAASLFMYSTRNNSGAADRAAALAIAQQRMERLRSVTFTDASLNTGTTNATVVSGGRNYRVNTVICETAACGGSSTLKKITIQVTPTSAGTVWASNAVTVTTLRASPISGTFLN